RRGLQRKTPGETRRGRCPALRPAVQNAVNPSVNTPASEALPMGFRQTAQHKNGKGSFHQIGLVRGQFGNVPEGQWIKFLQDTGFDGWEEASWELDLRRCDTDAGAA